MNLWVILPTSNEAPNLAAISEAIVCDFSYDPASIPGLLAALERSDRVTFPAASSRGGRLTGVC